MTDVSNDTPMEFDRGDPTRRCSAHRKNGEQCRKWAIVGGTVCATHGGAAKHVRNAARARIANAADLMAKQLLKMAVADDVSDSVKLAAIRDALDRASLGARAGVDVEVTAKPFEQILTHVETGSRAEYRRSIGQADDDPPALADVGALGAADTEPVDVDVVEVLSDAEYAARVTVRPQVTVVDHTEVPTDDERQRDGRTASGIDAPDELIAHAARLIGIDRPPPDGMMTAADAAEAVAELRRLAAARTRDAHEAARDGRTSAVIHPARRALPRGRG